MFTCTSSVKLSMANTHEFQSGNLWEGRRGIIEDLSMIFFIYIICNYPSEGKERPFSVGFGSDAQFKI